MKIGKQELEGEREKILITMQANEKLKLELREKQETIESELGARIDKVMENERHDHEMQMK